MIVKGRSYFSKAFNVKAHRYNPTLIHPTKTFIFLITLFPLSA